MTDEYRGGGWGFFKAIGNVVEAGVNAVQGNSDIAEEKMNDAAKNAVEDIPVVGKGLERAIDGEGFYIKTEEALEGALDIGLAAAGGVGGAVAK